MKKVLVIGGTGAIGRYTTQELLNEGYQVDVLSLDNVVSTHPRLRYMVGPGKNIRFMKKLLEAEKYDGIIDYLVYKTAEFASRFEMFLENTSHYIFLSSYRVYADDTVLTEKSPRLLDVSEDEAYLEKEDYSLYKARCENILRASKYKNWTIARPSITYSVKRYQCVLWEANILIPRTLQHKKILLPEEALNVESAMTWAGDSGKMFAKLLFSDKAYCEAFTISTAEHHPWSYVADCYTELLGTQFEITDRVTYLKVRSGGTIHWGCAYQLDYDRLLNRVVDNSKILRVTGLKQSDFMLLKEGLKRELGAVNLCEADWGALPGVNEAMDKVLRGETI